MGYHSFFNHICIMAGSDKVALQQGSNLSQRLRLFTLRHCQCCNINYIWGKLAWELQPTKTVEISLIRFTYMYITHIYNDTLHLPTFSESNAWVFSLVMTGIPKTSQQLLKISDKIAEHCRKCPKMFWWNLSTSEAI